MFSSNNTFKVHNTMVYEKAIKVLGFLNRASNEFKDINCLKVLYCSLVRSILKFGSIVWNTS